jgi:hypothetical protein
MTNSFLTVLLAQTDSMTAAHEEKKQLEMRAAFSFAHHGKRAEGRHRAKATQANQATRRPLAAATDFARRLLTEQPSRVPARRRPVGQAGRLPTA